MHDNLERLTRFVQSLSCCCRKFRCARCQALYGNMRRLISAERPPRGFNEIEQDPDEAEMNKILCEIAGLKRELAELRSESAAVLWTGLKLGDVCRSKHGAPARYLENGKVAYVSSMCNDRCFDDYGNPADGQELVLVGDEELPDLLDRLRHQMARGIIQPYQLK